MVFRILAGSYTNAIYSLEFDPSSASLKVISSTTVGRHPSWLSPHPDDVTLIFTGLEQPEGKVVVVKFDERGEGGKIVGEAPSGGADPASLLASKDQLFVGNYSGGTVSTFPISSKPPYLLAPEPFVMEFSGTGPHPDRQKTSHPHQIVIHPDRDELLIPDLGADKTWRFFKGNEGKWEPSGYVQYSPGGGPRHLVVRDGILYTLLELKSTLVAHQFPALPASPTPLSSILTLSDPPNPLEGMLAAEILFPEINNTYTTPYLYTSNRNDPSLAGDTIAIFSLSGPHHLELVAEVRTGLKHVRGIVIGGPDDKWLIAGGVNGGGVKVFERIDGGRGLKEIAANKAIEAPTGFVWL